ncbi:2-(1,2-epoxy-1,2-dihydrophenyl)acetyl-CoA isomerase PaaG [Pseudonocardia eucalypti]|uniref:2-(1,2-epoxy-1,2-dihydrophenyl)acetyl-CoA isomerase PaaG n=1 Tax=Pseudonocardia eucalypti TaxID=648755 RepID=A0ABP9RB64_9PSEU|nr:2-(1,2-epoxy-1,2-dihydrophenyl)acetyl-CoA isomerase [Pseudonocardia eucalypti]
MSTIKTEVRDGVCWLRLNRPERRNAWTAECGAAMTEALLRAEADPETRCVVVTGEGGAFCAGVDLRDGFERTPDGAPDLKGMHRRHFVPTILGLRTLPLPVITAVNGPAVGFGASLAMAGDFLVMAESATLRLAFVSLGLNPDSGGTHLLPRAVGRQRATEIAMLGEPVTAAKAVDWGIAHRAVPDACLEDAVAELAGRLAAGPTKAYAAIKRAFNSGEHPSLTEQLELEGELVHALATTADFQEGVGAFLERRPARFTGA